MSSSNSEAPIPTRQRAPTDKAIRSALRAAVQACYANDDEDNLTLKRIRAVVAKKLKLAEHFFKTSDKWNSKSKQIVLEEVDKHANAQGDVGAEEAHEPSPIQSPVKPRAKQSAKPKVKPKPAKTTVSDDEEDVDIESDDDDAEAEPSPAKLKKPVRKPAQKKEQKRPTKRKSDEGVAQTRRKRQKQVATSDEDVGSEEADEEEHKEEEFRNDTDIDEREEVEELHHDTEVEQKQPEQDEPISAKDATKPPPQAQESDSEMSIVFDEPPVKKGGRKKSTSSTTSSKAKKPASKDTASTKAKSTKPESTLTPQEEEIKRLQSWLVKCGTRKVWSKELSNCDTPKDKITHLKRLLKDVGMEGRFSEDKAKKIREEREFKKDLEEIREGNAKWGESEGSGEEGESGGRPRRKLARGLRELAAFDDEEESD